MARAQRLIAELLLGAAVVSSAGLSACADNHGPESCRGVRSQEAALFGAGPDAGSDAPVDGVVALFAQLSASTGELCSGVVVARNMILTASHCLEDGQSAAVFIGESIENPELVLAIGDVYADEERDLALAELVPDRERGSAPSPMPLALDHEIKVGDEALLAGYGLNELRRVGERRFVSEPIVDFDDELVVVDGRGASGACTGDSGGPLLLERDGKLYVLGILSGGSPTCTDLDVYQRLGPSADWLNERIGDHEAARPGDDGC